MLFRYREVALNRTLRLMGLSIFWVAAALACTIRPGTRPTPTPGLVIPIDREIPVEPPIAFTPEIDPTLLARPPLASLRAPEVGTTERAIVYSQGQRAFRSGLEMRFWPDGNLGFIPLGDQYRFFAANGSLTARTVGNLEDPAARVETNAQSIVRVSSEFSYAAGGPVYQDPDSGLLLMFYHAERHFGGSGFPFHSAIGLAASRDQGSTFNNLGIILETNATPDVTARCCADMGGATFAVKDGWFYLYFRDRLADAGLTDIHLAVATAPVDEVIAAALAGRTSEWLKHSAAGLEPSLGGRSSPLEIGNPQTNWFSVSYNTAINAFLMAVAQNGGTTSDPSWIYLIASEDGIVWSPRTQVWFCDCELAYPTLIDPGGSPLQTDDHFYIYFVSTTPGRQRWAESSLERLNVTLTGRLVEHPSLWEFEAIPIDWIQQNDIGTFELRDGALVIEPTGVDPYMQSSTLGLSTDLFTHIEVRMRTSADSTGEFFYTTTEVPSIAGGYSVRFPIRGTGNWEIYTEDMSAAPGWEGHIGVLRFDPTSRTTPVEIDYIRLLP
jgi:hypothetical protein